MPLSQLLNWKQTMVRVGKRQAEDAEKRAPFDVWNRIRRKIAGTLA
jgi:hypothetical protein